MELTNYCWDHQKTWHWPRSRYYGVEMSRISQDLWPSHFWGRVQGCHAHPQGLEGTPQWEGWKDHSPLIVQKDSLNHEAEQLQGVNLHSKNPGAGLQSVWYHMCCWQGKGARTWKRETNPLTTHCWLPEWGTAHVPALVHFSPWVVLWHSCYFPLSLAVSSP